MNPRLAFTLSWLMCLLCLGLPRVGLAAGDAPRAGSPRLALSGPLAGDGAPDALESSPEPERPRASRGLRVFTELGTGLLTSVGGGLGLGLVGLGLCGLTGFGYEPSLLGCTGPLLLGSIMGLLVGYPLGVWWGGELQGGNGSLLNSMLGAAVGLLVGSAVIATVYASGNESLYILPLVGVPVLFVTGAHLGYELFQRAPSAGVSRPSLQPLVSFSSRGALLGLGGRF